jgi:hypothetical protein
MKSIRTYLLLLCVLGLGACGDEGDLHDVCINDTKSIKVEYKIEGLSPSLGDFEFEEVFFGLSVITLTPINQHPLAPKDPYISEVSQKILDKGQSIFWGSSITIDSSVYLGSNPFFEIKAYFDRPLMGLPPISIKGQYKGIPWTYSYFSSNSLFLSYIQFSDSCEQTLTIHLDLTKWVLWANKVIPPVVLSHPDTGSSIDINKSLSDDFDKDYDLIVKEIYATVKDGPHF